jgi:hypothetical protein
MDETFVRIAGKWMYCFAQSMARARLWTSTCRRRGIREAAKLLLKKALAILTIGLPTYSPGMDCVVTWPRCESCKPKDMSRGTAASEHGAIAITESDPITAI